MNQTQSTPQTDLFRMPGEYEPHAGTWMLWPERQDVWRDEARPGQAAYVEVATAISQFEPVWMGVSAAQSQRARALLPAAVHVVEIESNDAWVRDSGPSFVIDSQRRVRAVDWAFNAWGGHYLDFQLDTQVAGRIAELAGVERYVCDMILEGGSIHVDGEGTLMVTEQCLLNPNRNPDLSKAQIEATLKAYLNVEKVIWIGRGVYEDETDGHVDNLACFIRPGVVALTWTDDKSDPQYEISAAAFEFLCSQSDAQGRNLKVVKIHQPTPMSMSAEEAAGLRPLEGSRPRLAGDRLAGSYINFYIANGGVVVPQFGDRYDRPALEALQGLFPDRKVVGVQTREVLLGGGNIHCITQQQPEGAV